MSSFIPTKTISVFSSRWQVWSCYLVIVVNSQGVWEEVLSKIYKLLPHISLQALTSSAPERSACQTYRVGSASLGWQLSRERQPQFKISTLASPLQSVRFWCARVFGVPDLPCGAGSSVGSDRACSNNRVHDHRHAPSKHNSSSR